jgi:ABC-type glycerol-3-phosphate transport system permease component
MATVTRDAAKTRISRRSGKRDRLLGPFGMVFLYAILLGGALATAFPFYWMMIASTHRSSTLLTVPPPIMPSNALSTNYEELMSRLYLTSGISIWGIMINSLVVSGTFTLLVLFFCSLGGYGFAKFRFPGREILFMLMLATMMIPNVLGIIPSFMLMRWLGWFDTWYPLIIPGIANAFGFFWMRQYIESSVPTDLMDSARIDGAHEFRIYWNIVLPIIKPALGALAILTFLGKWNEYFWPLLILKNTALFTIPIGLASLRNLYGQEIGVQMLGATIAIVPMMIIFFLSARQFMSGLTAGAVKGV